MIQTSWLCAVLVVAAHTPSHFLVPRATILTVNPNLLKRFGRLFNCQRDPGDYTFSQAPDQTLHRSIDRCTHCLAPLFHSISLLLDHSAILGDCASKVLFSYLSIHLIHFEASLDSRALSNGLHKALPSANAASSLFQQQLQQRMQAPT
jgi:hypothetical protein